MCMAGGEYSNEYPTSLIWDIYIMRLFPCIRYDTSQSIDLSLLQYLYISNDYTNYFHECARVISQQMLFRGKYSHSSQSEPTTRDPSPKPLLYVFFSFFTICNFF
ncbi:hypothetical protein L873DRAFT_329238 [Choiromyces venosus 120613-1]|uniref:Uncharacterized protein n=1 Tax=Choiromyces venosus 120613-1 TaxID=1336337 RepID=A0A3N4K0T8_9PEZI|nr:hypothetical protein L873DRAFT_329238 [Choiromyces venosus 120613-1]